MSPGEALQPAIIYLGAGLAAAFAARAARLSPVIGYLLVGLAIGKHGLGLVDENDTTRFLAELGVVFLLFEIGLHFSLREIQTRRQDIFRFAPLQVLLCTLAFVVAGLLLGFQPAIAGVIGASLALSSTAVVGRLLSDRKQPSCPIGRSATAVLVAQDLVAIFILVFAAVLNQNPDPEAVGIGMAVALGKAIIALGAALALGRYIVRPAFDALARTNNQEAFTAIALLLVLAASAATDFVGLSLTAGAFLAGMALSDTPYRHVIQHEVAPFQGLLLGLFFMSVGMNVNLPVMLAHWPAIMATALGILTIKTVLVFLAARLSHWNAPGAAQLGFLLSQGSEFTLVAVGIPSVAFAMPGIWSSLIVSAVAVTMVAAPVWTSLGVWIAHRIAERAKIDMTPVSETDGAPVIILGMTDEGRLAADALRDHEISYLAIESDPQRFVSATSDGYAVVYGDPRDIHLMESVSEHGARALVHGDPDTDVPSVLVQAKIGAPWFFAAVKTPADKKKQVSRGCRAHLSLAHPHGIELATDLLQQMGVEKATITAWVADQTELRGLRTNVSERAEEPA